MKEKGSGYRLLLSYWGSVRCCLFHVGGKVPVLVLGPYSMRAVETGKAIPAMKITSSIESTVQLPKIQPLGMMPV